MAFVLETGNGDHCHWKTPMATISNALLASYLIIIKEFFTLLNSDYSFQCLE